MPFSRPPPLFNILSIESFKKAAEDDDMDDEEDDEDDDEDDDELPLALLHSSSLSRIDVSLLVLTDSSDDDESSTGFV